MDGVGAAALAGGQDLIDVQVGFCSCATIQRDSAVCFRYEWCLGVAVGVNRDRAYPHVVSRANDAPRYLPAVSNQ